MSDSSAALRCAMLGVLLLALLVVFPPLAGAQTFETIDFPGAQGTWLLGINDRSDSVGFWIDGSGAAHFFIHRTGVGHGLRSGFESIEIGIPGATVIFPLSINNRGQVTGFYDDAEGGHGFVRDRDGSLLVIDVPVPGTSSTTATGTNARGQTVGFYSLVTDFPMFVNIGFLRDRRGELVSIQHPSVAGSQSLCRWPPDTSVCRDTKLWGINARGVITGSYALPDQPPDERSFVRDSKGLDYEDIEFPGATETRIHGAPNVGGNSLAATATMTNPM